MILPDMLKNAPMLKNMASRGGRGGSGARGKSAILGAQAGRGGRGGGSFGGDRGGRGGDRGEICFYSPLSCSKFYLFKATTSDNQYDIFYINYIII